ncbi:MAG: hypothetical protein PHU96_00465 [Candidatus Omnitrophica bacterium]|nr:hypothetical protein [Candidatus Omnitrophota bacterium]
MQIWPQKLKYEFKRSVCVIFALFLFVVIGAGCATPTPPPPEQGQYIKVQVGQNSVSVPWSNNQTQASNQVTMQQIVDWTKQGVSSDEIISRIKAANPRYSLTADDLGFLKRQGVSQRVIETMQAYH